jgi:DNA polymerase-3 subunit beta
MEFSIARTELLAGLYLTQGIVERRTTIPILSNVLIQAVAGGVTVVATDQEVAVRRTCTAMVKRKGTLTTGARKLYEMVRELPETDVRIASLDNNWIEVSAGRSRFRLVGMDPREFPAIAPPPAKAAGASMQVTAATFTEMIERTIFAVSSDEARTNLNGIFIEAAGAARMRAVATDGHRLAMIVRAVEGSAPEKGVIVPRKAVLELRKVLEGGEEAVTLVVDGGMVHAQRGPVEMSMRLVEGEFPDYHQVVPKKTERVATLGVGDLLSALRRVSVVSSERTRGVKLQVENQRLELSAINPEVGEATEELEVDYDGAALTIGFNARYLIEALSVMAHDRRVEIGLNDDVSPGALREAGDPDYCYIVMPMRL